MPQNKPAHAGSALVSVAEFRQKLLARVKPVLQTENLPLLQCAGRVLAENLVSAIDVPPADNSAMDGYAIRAADFSDGASLTVTQKIFAGHQGEPLQAGQAARIFTGASIPLNADAVVMQENCEEVDGQLRISSAPEQGDHIRPRGQDIAIGAEVLKLGRRLGARDIGLAASLGQAHLKVYKTLKVAILSTGDELLEPGEPAQANKIYNSNRYLLHGLLSDLACEVIDAGITVDDEQATREKLLSLSKTVDLVISSGGVSVGEADFVRTVLAQLGALEFWKLAMKPGKPVAFGLINDTPFFGLPGNPVSTFVTFMILARPFLLRLQGITADVLPQAVQMIAAFDWPKAGTRQEYLRVRRAYDSSGRSSVELFDNQSSGVLSSVAWADGLVEVPVGATVTEGDLVDVLLFEDGF